jgi:hypothetical protein
MTIFLARSISTAKWKSQNNIAEDEIAADAVTYDMRTSDNTLSFWLFDSGREGSLEEVALALACARDNIQRLDLVWLVHKQVEEINLRINPTLGATPARHLQQFHRDVVGIDLVRLKTLADCIAKAVRDNQTKRFTEKQVHNLLFKATSDKLVSLIDLKVSIAEKLQQQSQQSQQIETG